MMKIIRSGKEYMMTADEVFEAADAVLFNTNPHCEISRDGQKIELTKEECRSCLVEWGIDYAKRAKENTKNRAYIHH